MTSITSKAKFRQRVIRYSEKYGVTAASIKIKIGSITDLSLTVRASTIVKRIPSIFRSGFIPRLT